jgi:hypothetical protein
VNIGGLSNALRGIGGEFEITRVVGFFGGVAYILGANGFVAWNMLEGRAFDLTAYCVAFPSGLGVMVAAIAGSASVKDRNVAVAKATEAKTKADPAGTGMAGEPLPVTVVNPPENPVNVDQQP